MARRVRIHAPGAPHQIISREKERGERLAPEKHLLLDVERNARMHDRPSTPNSYALSAPTSPITLKCEDQYSGPGFVEVRVLG